MAEDRVTRRVARRAPLVIGIVVLSVVLVALLATTAVLAVSRLGWLEAPYAHPVPWASGERLTPLATTDPLVRSVVRAQQYELAWRSTARQGPDEITDLVRTRFSFDPLDRRGEPTTVLPGLLAGIDVSTPSGPGDALVPNVSLDEFYTTAAAAANRDRRRERMGGTPVPISLLGVPDATAIRHPSTTSPCTSGVGLTVQATVAETVLVSATSACLPDPDDTQPVLDALLDRAALGVGVATAAQQVGVPDRWLDRTADLPILSGGHWDQQQIVVAGRTDRFDGETMLTAPFAGSGVELAFLAQDQVYVYADTAAAERVLTAVPSIELDDSYADAPAPVDHGAADQRLCVTAIHWQLGTTCWSRVGRFVVVHQTRGSRDGSAPTVDESQVKALVGVR